MGASEISMQCLPTWALLAFRIGESFVLGDWCVHCEIFSGIAGLYPLHVGSTFPQVMTIKNILRQCQVSSGEHNWPKLRTTELGGNEVDGESREGARPVRERPLEEQKHRSTTAGRVRCNVVMSGFDDDGGGGGKNVW